MDEKEAQSKKPEDSDFQQQRLRAWQPLLTPKWVILTFFLIGVIFLPIGIAILVASRDVVEYSLRYDNDPRLAGCDMTARHMGYNDTYGIARGFQPDIANPQAYQRSEKCKVRLEFGIKNKMKGPVFVYYKLTNFYQNHRRYVKSRSDIQLRGKSGPTDTTSCDPLSDIGSLPIYPCGLIANSVFNDTFDGYYTPKGGSEIQLGLGGWDPRNPSSDTIVRAKNENATWQKAGTSWKTDREDKFSYINTTKDEIDKKLTTTGPGEFTLPRVDDEDFIVWMRTAGLPTFKKLYRVIHQDFYEGDVISINVSSVFPVSDFSGEKYVVISTTSWLGGKNDFLGVAYIVVGAICLFLAAIFLLKHCISPRPLGDMTYFNWPGQTPIRSKAAPRMAQ